jgi:hypothetical protein
MTLTRPLSSAGFVAAATAESPGMATVLEADPEVRRAVERIHASSAAERRCTARRPFRAVQRIAQTTGTSVPEQTAFFPVKCHDLSTRGFSFVVKTQPQFKSLVLALGTPPQVVYLAAEVRHCTDVFVDPSGQVVVVPGQAAANGRGRRGRNGVECGVLVGCEFLRRLG